MANRHGLDEIAVIAAATASGLAKLARGVNPQASANRSRASAAAASLAIVLSGMPRR